MKAKKILKRVFLTMAAIILLLAGAFFLYTMQYYKADETALKIYQTDSASIAVKKEYTCFYPEPDKDLKKAFLFYPGGKVEETAYAPLLEKLSKEGLTCILLKMPFHLAVFDINAADKVFADFPDIKSFYIGGHSLGGAMASSYAVKHQDKVKGLILLAAYPVKKTELPSIILYGSEDGVLNRKKLEGLSGIHEIAGGNHAWFGDYGIQKGDGKAAITREAQQEETVKVIMDFLSKIS